MKFTAILALLPLALASPLADNSAAILNDLKTASTQAVNVNNTLNTFADNAGSVSGNTIIKLENQEQALANAVVAAGKAANTTNPLTKTESENIAESVLNLQPVTFSVLNNLVAHKVAFNNAGVLSIVISDLKSLKTDVANFGNALTPKLVQPYRSQAPTIQQNFATHFQNAINSLSS